MATVWFIGCASGDQSAGFGGSGTGASGGSTSLPVGGGKAAGGGSTTSTFATGSVGGGATTGAGGAGPSVVYAHTNTTLFQVDPISLAVSQIGDFDCIGGSGEDTSMTDVAVNSAGEVWGISKTMTYLLDVQPGAVHCAQKIPLNGGGGVVFYALTFAPAGLLGTGEVLVAGNTAGELWAIDSTGQLSQHGVFGTVPKDDGRNHTYPNPGGAWELSGDIVFLANGGSPVGFATVRDCKNPPDSSDCDKHDTLVQIDMTKLAATGAQDVTLSVRGQVVEGAGCTMSSTDSDFGELYGIGAWGTKIYGFSHSGALLDVSNDDATACVVQFFNQDSWAGAGVSTQAPIMPPPPH